MTPWKRMDLLCTNMCTSFNLCIGWYYYWCMYNRAYVGKPSSFR